MLTINSCKRHPSLPNILLVIMGRPFGHMDVDYSRWYDANDGGGSGGGGAYSIVGPNIYFEPYFLARTDDLASFDERFRGYGAGDKARDDPAPHA